MGRARRGAVPSRYWHLPHVEPGLRPMTWPKVSGSRITRNTRRAARSLRTPPPVRRKRRCRRRVVAEPFANQQGAASQWVQRGPVTPATGSVDVARVAAGAIAEAEGGFTRRPQTPRNRSHAPTGDDFVAPPLPEGMSVLGANVVAFALSTEHSVGERVYPRFPLRLGGPRGALQRFPHHGPRAGLVPDQRRTRPRPRGPRPRRGRLRLQLVARALPGRGARPQASPCTAAFGTLQDG
jgi:hypothetical protein